MFFNVKIKNFTLQKQSKFLKTLEKLLKKVNSKKKKKNYDESSDKESFEGKKKYLK